MSHRRGVAASIAIWLAFAIAAAASERKPLPAFQTIAPDGAAVASSRLSAQPRWLLVYLTPDSPSSARLLAALTAWQDATLLSRVVVVVGGPAEQAQPLMAPDPAGSGARYKWYADPQLAARAALGLDNAPAIVGINRGVVEWTITGVLNEPAALETVIRRWVDY